MPRCKSLVNDAHLAIIKSEITAQFIRVVSESDFGDGLHIVEVEGDSVPADGSMMKIIIVDGETIRFRDDVDT